MSSITAPLGPAALEGLPNLKPGVELAVLIESCADRLHELDGCQLVEFRAAIARQQAHQDAIAMWATRELTLRPPGFKPVAAPAPVEHPEDHAAGELEMACGWSRYRANSQIALAHDLTQDLPETLVALEAGVFELDVARTIVEGTAVLSRDLLARRLVEARVLVWIGDSAARGMRRPRHQVEKRVKAEVLKVDPDAAVKRHAKR